MLPAYIFSTTLNISAFDKYLQHLPQVLSWGGYSHAYQSSGILNYLPQLFFYWRASLPEPYPAILLSISPILPFRIKNLPQPDAPAIGGFRILECEG
jgi:hypothetical protein